MDYIRTCTHTQACSSLPCHCTGFSGHVLHSVLPFFALTFIFLIPTHNLTHSHTRSLTHTHGHSLTHTHSLSHTHSLTHTYSFKHTHTHSHSHTHTLTYSPDVFPCVFSSCVFLCSALFFSPLPSFCHCCGHQNDTWQGCVCVCVCVCT